MTERRGLYSENIANPFVRRLRDQTSAHSSNLEAPSLLRKSITPHFLANSNLVAFEYRVAASLLCFHVLRMASPSKEMLVRIELDQGGSFLIIGSKFLVRNEPGHRGSDFVHASSNVAYFRKVGV